MPFPSPPFSTDSLHDGHLRSPRHADRRRPTPSRLRRPTQRDAGADRRTQRDAAAHEDPDRPARRPRPRETPPPDRVAPTTPRAERSLAAPRSAARRAAAWPMMAVPRPGRGADHERPLASSTRSRIEASPTRPVTQEVARREPSSNPCPSSSTSIRSCESSACTSDHHLRRRRVLRRRSAAPPARPGRRASRGRRAAGARARPANSVSTPVSAPNRRASRGAPASARAPRAPAAGGPTSDRRSASASPASSSRIFASTSTPSLDVAGLDHQQRRLERERRRGDALHRPVVQVARDAVALLLRSRRSFGAAAASGPRRGPAGTGTATGSSGRRPRAAVTSRTSSSVRGGSVGTADARDSRCNTCPSRRVDLRLPARSETGEARRRRPSTTEASAVHG